MTVCELNVDSNPIARLALCNSATFIMQVCLVITEHVNLFQNTANLSTVHIELVKYLVVLWCQNGCT